jgi:hypothetical protein
MRVLLITLSLCLVVSPVSAQTWQPPPWSVGTFSYSALVAIITVGSADAQDSATAAQTAVESWLGLVDGQRYDESWQAAAAFFRNSVTQRAWQEAAQAARSPLGSLKSRAVKSTTSTKTLPGAPDGDYVVLQYNTTFERKASALETVTVVREPDGGWRVVGYFVR